MTPATWLLYIIGAVVGYGIGILLRIIFKWIDGVKEITITIKNEAS